MKRVFLHFIFLLFTAQFWAQQPVTIQLTEKDGLPDIEFYNVLEDKRGFIWFAALDAQLKKQLNHHALNSMKSWYSCCY